MNKRREGVTAEELMRQLSADKNWLAEQERREAARQVIISRANARVRAICDALAEANVVVDTLEDVGPEHATADGISVLAGALQVEADDTVAERVAAALARMHTSAATDAVLDEVERRSPHAPELGWALANLVVEAVDPSHAARLVALAEDVGNGRARETLVLALGNSDSDVAKEAVLRALDDGALAGYAAIAAGALRLQAALPALERLTRSSVPWVRQEARRAIAKIRPKSQRRRGYSEPT